MALLFRLTGYMACGIFAVTATSIHASGIQFEEATGPAGISFTGSTFGGGSWGDVNGDGWPDVWIAGHFGNTPAKLYVNNGDGTFSDETNRIAYRPTDTHGSAWADFDNDGDQDLLMLVGAASGLGRGPNQFFINEGGLLTDQAAAYNLDFPFGRARTPLWFDWNGDGVLDVFVSNWNRSDGRAPSRLFSQTGGVFIDSFSETGLTSIMSDDFAQLITIGRNAPPSLLITGHPSQKLYDYQSTPFSGLTGLEPLTTTNYFDWTVLDTTIADFNGDLLSDAFLVRQTEASEAIQTDTNIISASIIIRGEEKGFTFRADGVVQFQIEPPWEVALSDIYIGSSGVNPLERVFSVSSADSNTAGLLAHSPGIDFGVYIGYDTQTGLWQVIFSRSSWLGVATKVTAEAPITELDTVGFVNSDGALNDILLLQGDASFIDNSFLSGVSGPSACESAVAEDFDNDMDVDLYLVCQGRAANSPNILYENLGNGIFQTALDVGGAAGSSLGRGNGVSTVDYDGDGYIDLLVTNGRGLAPLNDGPAQLFRNTGSGNNWLELALEGVMSNRDAIGARVLVTAGGITQMRDLDGGMHRFTQNHKRLHFGLAGNTVVDQILIKWPNGLEQTLTGFAANQVLKVTEGVEPNRKPTITAIPSQTINEDSSTGALAFMVNDAETAAAALTVAVSSSDQTLISGANAVLDGTGADRTIDLAPVADKNGGPVVITVTVNDGEDTVSTTFNVVVRPVDDSPVAQDDSLSVEAIGSININVTQNDSDADENMDLASINVIAKPMNGDVSVKANGTIDYIETDIGATSDIFTYTISDTGGAVSNIATVSISITPGSLTTGEAIALGLDPNSPDGDTDNDGVSDFIEVGGDSANPRDSDSDGIIDALEPGADASDAGIVSGLTLASGDAVTISTAAGESLSQVTIAPATGAPDGMVFLFGAIGYTTSSPPGGSVTVRLAFSADLPENMVAYKVDSAGKYTELPAGIWALAGPRMVDITLTDGDPETDLDGVVNGSIEDPIALGSVVPAATGGSAGSGGGGGGCVLNPVADKDPVLSVLVLFFLIYLTRGYSITKRGRQA